MSPYKDPEKRKEMTRNWRRRAIPDGYGKALYARRAARYRNEEILREAVERAMDILNIPTVKVENLRANREMLRQVLTEALEAAPPVGPPKDYLPHRRKSKEGGTSADGN